MIGGKVRVTLLGTERVRLEPGGAFSGHRRNYRKRPNDAPRCWRRNMASLAFARGRKDEELGAEMARHERRA
jgi:hypothetical protein